MADVNKYFGTGGIVVANNFDISVSKPIDSRTTVANAIGLAELKSDGRVYEGLIAFNEAGQTYHQYINGDWKTLAVNSLEELKALIASETTAALEFKGAITNGILPTVAEKGDMYKIATVNLTIAAANNAEETEESVVAKPGDAIVYEGDNKWYYIPSGDDIEDTWRPVKAGGNTLAENETLELVAGDNVTISEADGKVTISATDTNTHYESKLVMSGDGNGSVDTDASNGEVYLNLIENDGIQSSHKIVGAGGISVKFETAKDENGENILTIEAAEGAKYDLEASKSSTNGKVEISLKGTDGTTDAILMKGSGLATVTTDSMGSIEVKVPSITYAALADNLSNDISNTSNKASTAYGWGDHSQQGYLKADDIANKMDKVSGVQDEIAVFDANGQVVGSRRTIDGINKSLQQTLDDAEEYAYNLMASLDAQIPSEGGSYVEVEVTQEGGFITAVSVDDSAIDTKLAEYKTKQTVVADPTASGNAIAFIDSISQNANGVITATKKSVDFSNYYTKEEVNATNKTQDDAIAKLRSDFEEITEIGGEPNKVDDVKIGSTSIVSSKVATIAVDGTYNASTNKIATESTVNTAINELNASVSSEAPEGGEGHGISVTVTQTEGKITNIAVNGDYNLHYDEQGAASAALEEAKIYTNTEIEGLEFELASDGKTLNLKNSAGTVVATLNTSKFVTDGMLSEVAVDKSANTLTFKWNTDSGVQETTVALSDIADIYTGVNGDTVNVAISNENKISAALAPAYKATLDSAVEAAQEVYSWGNHANAGYAKAENLRGLAFKEEVTATELSSEMTLAIGEGVQAYKAVTNDETGLAAAHTKAQKGIDDAEAARQLAASKATMDEVAKKYLPLTGGTLSGTLTVQGAVVTTALNNGGALIVPANENGTLATRTYVDDKIGSKKTETAEATGVYADIQGATTNTVKDCVDAINTISTQLTWGSF